MIDVMNPDSDDLDSSSGKITRQEPVEPDSSAAGEVRMVPVQFSAWMPGGTDAFRGPTFSTGSGFPPSILPPGLRSTYRRLVQPTFSADRRFPQPMFIIRVHFRPRIFSAAMFSPDDGHRMFSTECL